jgi:hypothetical protein
VSYISRKWLAQQPHSMSTLGATSTTAADPAEEQPTIDLRTETYCTNLPPLQPAGTQAGTYLRAIPCGRRCGAPAVVLEQHRLDRHVQAAPGTCTRGVGFGRHAVVCQGQRFASGSTGSQPVLVLPY